MLNFYNTPIATSGSSLVFENKLGDVTTPFFGKDLYFFNSKVFVSTVSSYNQLLSTIAAKEESVRNGYFVELLLVGLGFRFIKLGNILLLKLGFAHYIKITIPQSIIVLGYKKKLIIFGISSSEIKQFTCQLVAFRSPDVYKNKGIQLVGVKFRLKVGKQK